MRYREDIDGLRAVAVSIIVLFHFGVSSLSGGYVGVDVFFVISGFLITKLILEDIRQGRFSLGNFYHRRVRRIAPSLLATLSLTLAGGYFVLSPAHFEDLGLATQATVLSLSNVLFWTQSGYFDTNAIYKPLLHTWSLAVEEQFYFVWPLLLVFLVKKTTRPRALLCLGGLSLLSLGSAEFVLKRDPAGAFFLPLFRIYEFGFGAALAITGRIARPGAGAHLASVAGLALIIGAGLGYSEHVRFPGLTALVPCLGAALLIYSGPHGAINRVLAIHQIRYVGLISYSLYLVHWPILVYFAYYRGIPNTWVEIAALCSAALVLAALLYHLVETPFRKKVPAGFWISGKQLGISVSVTALVITLLGGRIDEMRGYPDRLSGEMRAVQDRITHAKAERRAAIRLTNCHFTPDTADALAEDMSDCLPTKVRNAIVVVGDSHAADVWVGLSDTFPDRTIVQFTGAGCDFGRSGAVEGLIDRSHCSGLQTVSERWISENSEGIAAIIYSQRAASMLRGDPSKDGAVLAPDTEKLVALETALRRVAAHGNKVIFWGPRHEFHPALDVAVARFPNLDALGAVYANLNLKPYTDLDGTLAARFQASPVTYASSLVPLCDPDCPLILNDGTPAIVDYGHWSPSGARLAVSRIVRNTPVLEALLGVPESSGPDE